MPGQPVQYEADSVMLTCHLALCTCIRCAIADAVTVQSVNVTLTALSLALSPSPKSTFSSELLSVCTLQSDPVSWWVY